VALLLPTERALLLAAVAALVLLGQQTYSQLQGITTSAQFAPVGILGAVIFVITSVVQLLRTLDPADWQRPTMAGAWRVHDVVAHLLDTALRRLRAQYHPGEADLIGPHFTLVFGASAGLTPPAAAVHR